MRRLTAITLSTTLLFQAAPLMAAAPAPLSQAPGVQPGAIKGTAQNSAGQPLANRTVQARDMQTGQIAGKTASDAAGAFSLSGLPVASYVVEIVDEAGKVLGVSSTIAVAAGATATIAMTVSGVAAAAAPVAAAGAVAGVASAGGISAAVVITTVAAAAGIAGVVIVRENASPSR